jgi:hypothetical protein
MAQCLSGEFILELAFIEGKNAIHDREFYFTLPEAGKVRIISFFYLSPADKTNLLCRSGGDLLDRVFERHKMAVMDERKEFGEG